MGEPETPESDGPGPRHDGERGRSRASWVRPRPLYLGAHTAAALQDARDRSPD